MSSPAEKALGAGGSGDIHRIPSPGTEPSAIPFTESHLYTPAITMDTPGDAAEAKELSAATQEDKCKGGADTPRKPGTNLGVLESQFQELQAKMAELEKQADSERRKRQSLELRVSNEAVPLVFGNKVLTPQRKRELEDLMLFLPTNYAEKLVRNFFDDDGNGDEDGDEDNNEGYIEERFARFKGYDDNDSQVGSKYTSKAIHVFERELRKLYKEEKKARTIRDDRDRLQTMEQKWQEEREELLRKQRELRQELRGPGAKTRRPSEVSLVEMDNSGEATPQSVQEKAELNFVDWNTWQTCILREPSFFAIDVLKGEPILYWEQPTRIRRANGYLEATEEKSKPRKTAPSAKSPLVPGQAPVPERIQINSVYIQRIFCEIDSDLSISDGPLVMIRPYKALDYYEESIRFKLQELEAKFAHDDAALEDIDTASQPEKKNPEDYTGGESTRVTASEEGVSPEIIGAEGYDKVKAEEDEDEFTSSPTAYQHLKCLVSFMDEQLRTKIVYLSSDRCQTVSFPDIWYLFKPGDEVIDQSRRQVYRIMGISSAPHKMFSPYRPRWDKELRARETTPVVLDCVYLDFDGKDLGPGLRKVRIAKFDGEKAITSLEVYPLRFAEERRTVDERQDVAGFKKPQKPNLRERLIARGRMFINVTTWSFKHMHYSGLTLDTLDEVDSHVVVDFEEAFSHAPKNNANSSKHDTLEDRHVEDTVEPGWRPMLWDMTRPSTEDFGDMYCMEACCATSNDIIHRDSYAERKRNEEYVALLMSEDGKRELPPTIYPRPIADIKGQENALPDKDLLIMSYRVFGFILRSRKWAQLNLNHLTLPENAVKDGNIKTEGNETNLESQSKTEKVNSGSDVAGGKHVDAFASEKRQEEKTAFGQLVLPPGHKEMVKSLIAQHFRDKESASEESREAQQVDIVRGKGKGLIILLHGAPGVGKTTTAEGVAEMFKKPLFQVTCGDLGTSAPEVEKALETHFSLANRWGCVLLLDEADVFLAARSKEDFKRNGLVSVFLRVMEYYAGILFLTTNRVGDFDEAFASRIHISLYYPHLDLANTRAIFKLNLNIIRERFNKKGRRIFIEEPEILQSAETYYTERKEERWNGRQIRNACQTALALAEYRAQGNSYLNTVDPDAGVELKVTDLEVVSKAYQQFITHLNNIRGKNAEMWAKGLKLRAREIDVLFMDKNKEQAAKEKQTEDAPVPVASGHQQLPAQAGAAPPTAGLPAPAVPLTPVPPAGAFSAQPAAAQGAPPGPPMGQHYGPQGYYQWYGQYGLPSTAGFPPPAGPQGNQQQWAGWSQQATQQGPPPGGMPPAPSTVPTS